MQRAAGHALDEPRQIASDDARNAHPMRLLGEEGAIIRFTRAVAERGVPGLRGNGSDGRRRRDEPVGSAVDLKPLVDALAGCAEPIHRDNNHRRMVGEPIGKLGAVAARAKKKSHPNS